MDIVGTNPAPTGTEAATPPAGAPPAAPPANATVPPEAGAVAPLSDKAARGELASPRMGAAAGAENWRAGIPQELRDALGDTDPAEAAKIYARGKDYVPAAKAEDITLKLGEGEIHPGLEKHFKDFCVIHGITPKQAQAIAEYNGIFAAEANRIYLEHGNAALEQRFGADTGKVRDNALKAFMNLDRKMDGRLSASPSGKQIASDPLVVEALYLIHEAMSEHSIGRGTSGANDEAPMETKAFLEDVLKRQQSAGSAQ